MNADPYLAAIRWDPGIPRRGVAAPIRTSSVTNQGPQQIPRLLLEPVEASPSYVLVNPKQFHRILARRFVRQRLGDAKHFKSIYQKMNPIRGQHRGELPPPKTMAPSFSPATQNHDPHNLPAHPPMDPTSDGNVFAGPPASTGQSSFGLPSFGRDSHPPGMMYNQVLHEQNHDAQNMPVRLSLEHSSTGTALAGLARGPDRSSIETPNFPRGGPFTNNGFFKRTFKPSSSYNPGNSSESWDHPHEREEPAQPAYRNEGFGNLVPSSMSNTFAAPYKSVYGSSSLGMFGLDGQGMSSSWADTDHAHDATPSVQRAESSLSVVVRSLTPSSLYDQDELSGTGHQILDSSRSLSDPAGPTSISAPRKGRPPKSSNFVIELPSVTLQKRGALSKDSVKAPSKDLNSKKRGRPYKTAESAAKAAARASGAASDSGDGLVKKKGRPSKVRNQLDIPVPEPEYKAFICEWKGCLAELHNLDTLKAHVFIVHGEKQPSADLICLWGKCGAKGGELLKTQIEWVEHINGQHLIPFAWHMGDGPKATSLCMFL